MTSIAPDADPASLEAVVALTSGSFDDYPLSAVLLTALAERGLRSPTPIQAAAIPALLNGRDVVGQARTGSGKTLAFSLPLLDAIDAGRASIQALVLAPTRELASQVGAVIADLGAVKGVTVALLYGGTSSGPQRTALRRGAQVAVGTPGRILDLISQGALWLDQARFVVLDEADEMFDQGFAQDVERIMDKTSNSRQTALFSATMPDWVQQTAARYLYDPETIAVDGGAETVSTVPHVAYIIPTGGSDRPGERSRFGGRRDEADMQAKLGALRDLLDHRGDGKTIVFGRTKQGVAALSKQLDRAGYPVGALQGNMTQAERDFVMEAFRSGRIDILVATNVAARGLDLADVHLVVNVELPESAEMLTHRVGRTGRMGRAGQAITLLAGADLLRWQLLTRDVSLPIRQLPWEGATAALALGDAEHALQHDVRSDQPMPIAVPDGSLTETDYPVEEGSIMDDSPAPERSSNERTSEPAQPDAGRPNRPIRRPSRRPVDGGANPERTRPVDDAADLIARALASVNVTSPAPALPRTDPIPPITVARQAVQLGREVVPPEQTATSRGSVPPTPNILVDRTAPPVAVSVTRPQPLRGTPRPPWVRDAAERVARWQIGGPLTTSTPLMTTPSPALRGGMPDPVTSSLARATPAPRPAGVDPTARPERPGPPPAQPTRDERPVDQPGATRFDRSVDEAADESPTIIADQPASRLSDLLSDQAVAEPFDLDQGAAPPADPPATQYPAATPPAVRRRASSPIVDPVRRDAMVPDVSAPEPVASGPMSVRPIPTVRPSRSRPNPMIEPVLTSPPVTRSSVDQPDNQTTETVPVESPLAATDPEITPNTVTETTVPTDAEPLETEERSTAANGEADGPTVVAPVPQAEAEAPVMTDEPSAAAPPVRRRSRTTSNQAPSVADAVAEPSTPSPDDPATAESGLAASAEPTEPATPVGEAPAEASEPAPKPSRRASARRGKATTGQPATPDLTEVEATGATEQTVAEIVDRTDSSPADPSAGATEVVLDDTVAPPARMGSRSRSVQGQTAADVTAPESTAAMDGDTGTAAGAGDGPDPKPRPSRSRSRAPKTEPAGTATDGESAPGRQRTPRPNAEPVVSETVSPDEPAPGNRRPPSQRPAGGTPGSRGPGSGGSGGGRGAGGASQRSRPAESGDTSVPERGNSALAQPSRRAPVGSTPGGAPYRRRPMATPSTRCAACGTPQPKGSTRKYCPACERELALRSQEP